MSARPPLTARMPAIHHLVLGAEHPGLREGCPYCPPPLHRLVALAGPAAPPTGAPVRHPALGATVVFSIAQHTWRAGVMVGPGRVAYVAAVDLADAGRRDVPVPVRHHRPPRFWVQP